MAAAGSILSKSSVSSVCSACRAREFSSVSSSLFWSGNTVFADVLGGVQQGSVLVQQGKIQQCLVGHDRNDSESLAATLKCPWHDLGQSNVLSPGMIDVHTHISALGNRDWEGYVTATKAAAAGGITTIMGMPLNSIPATTSPDVFDQERAKALEGPLYANVGLWGGVVPSNTNETDLNALLDAGVYGVKAFLSPLPEAAGFVSVSPEQLSEAARICGERNKPILVHSELMTEEEVAKQIAIAFPSPKSRTTHQAHVNSRPPEWEQDAVALVCSLSKTCSMHIVHLSDAGCLPMIARAKADGDCKLTVETCPHYLVLDASMISDKDTRAKCFPPIRGPENQAALWEALFDGTIDMIASDHSPCEPSLRCRETGDFLEAWGGLSGLQYQLHATFSKASAKQFDVGSMAKWWSNNPARMIPGMQNIRGSIEPGKQADFCWWDPNHIGAPKEYSKEHHRWSGSCFYSDDETMRGMVLGTWVSGVQVYEGRDDIHMDPAGEFLSCSDG